MTPAQQIALWADKLRDMSAMGLHFSKDIYDQQRYHEMQTMAMEMHALATGDSFESLEPLRDTIYSRPMPFPCAEGAVIDAAGRILLIQRADNGKWALPGGGLEVGETGAQGALREVLEETGVHCAVTNLVGVFDSRLRGSMSRHHFYVLIYLCKPTGEPGVDPSHPHEILNQGWFAEDALPADLGPSHVPGVTHAFRVWRGGEPFFDH
jgi:ADP-ribose pyrophosphatase YjhB (NUDIX family)